MVERTGCCADRTTDINIRVGMKNPPADGTAGDEEFTENELCGIFIGPGQLGTTSVLNCDGEYFFLGKVDIFSAVSEPRFGRFVTLQRVSSVVSDYSINWREVIVHYETVDINENDDIATVRIAVDTGN